MNIHFVNQINDLHDINEHEIIVEIIKNIPHSCWNYELIGLLARAYNNLSEYNKALEILLSIKKNGQNDALWNFSVGYSYFFNEQYSLAKTFFETSAKLGNHQAYDFLGLCNHHLIKEKKLEIEKRWYEFTIQFVKKLKENDNDWDKLSEKEQELAALWKLEIAIYNNGFLEFFFNEGCIGYQHASRCLQRLGAFTTLKIIQKQYQIIKRLDKSKDTIQRWEIPELLTYNEKIHLSEVLDMEHYDSSDNIFEKTFITYLELIDK